MRDDSVAKYGFISKTLHWLIAILIFWQLLKLGDRINDGEHWVGLTLVPWHVSIGTLVLVLVVLRILWAVRQRGHRPPPAPGRALLVRGGHLLLYVAMAALPVTGILYLVGEGYGLNAFGLQLLPKGAPIEWAHTVGEAHEFFAWALLIMVIGHIGIALYHHFVKRDDVLRRML